METQPISLVLLLLASAFAGQNASPLLDPVSIMLLLLGLQWWAMFVYYLVRQRGLSAEWAEVIHISGLCLAFALTLVTHLQLLHNIAALVVAAGLIVWFWRRGMKLARLERSDEYLITSFKIGFIVLLIVLVLTVIYFSPSYQCGLFDPSYQCDLTYTALHEAVARGLIIYFLSGVLSLSLTRISFIRRANAYRAPSNTVRDPTRLWLVILMLFWGVVTAAALALETFSFAAVTLVMTWFWNGLGALVNWLLGLITLLLAFLLNLLAPLFPPMVIHSRPSPSHAPTGQHPTPPPQPPPDILNLIRLLLLLAVLVVLVLIIRSILRRLRLHVDEESEEERESLSMQSVLRERLGERRKSRQKSEGVVLEHLAPDSVRARYRQLLQALAEQGAPLAHQPAETPTQYEARLLALLEKTASMQEEGNDTPSDAALLEQLTHAYVQERYGEKHTRFGYNAYLPAWIARFVKRLSNRNASA